MYANNSKNYWVVELADGIIQRETEFLLNSGEVKSRNNKLIFCSVDAFGMIGGLRILKEKFGLIPDALSGRCLSSPLYIRELSEFTEIPLFNSADESFDQFTKILTQPKKRVIKNKAGLIKMASNF